VTYNIEDRRYKAKSVSQWCVLVKFTLYLLDTALLYNYVTLSCIVAAAIIEKYEYIETKKHEGGKGKARDGNTCKDEN
jgi:hypothetical protein